MSDYRTCQSCGGVLMKGKSSHRAREKYFTLIVEDIPAYQCQRCGKVLFEEETVDRLQRLTRRIKRETEEIVSGKVSANLYDY